MNKKRSTTNALPYTLGELELKSLEIIWQVHQVDAQTLHAALPDKQRPSANTVQSTLERLRKKGLLTRTKANRRYLYQATATRSELMGKMMGGVIKTLFDGKKETLLSSFVSAAESIDEGSLDYLSELIARRKTSTADDSDGGSD